MRNLATCYSDKAVKVSDSYCSFANPNRSYHSPIQTPSTKNAVISTYKVKLSSQKHLLISMTWSTNRGFWVNVADSNPVRMGSEKGKEIFGACGSTIQVYWDLSNAIFDGPNLQPVSSFYVVVLIDSIPGLHLGDMPEGDLPPVKFSLVSQCEHLSGSTQFSTRARFSESGQAHEVVIRCGPSTEGPNVLSVIIDKRRVVRITGLKWNFRGNQLLFVDGLMVDVMWDLHRWIKERSTVRDGGGYDGVFMFRTRSGLNSRLWLQEKIQDEFSFLLCLTRNHV